MRQRIDATLKPNAKLTHQTRNTIIISLKQQLKGDRPYDRTLLTVLMHLFN